MDVLETALRLLDERGLPDLSMRALARELDVQPSALYWHFKNKQELLAGVADAILAPVAQLPEGTGAAEAAAAFREAMLSVTDGAEVVVSTIALGLGADRAFERLRIALEADGYERNAAVSGATTLLHYCIGHTSHEQQRAQAFRIGVDLNESPITADASSFAEGVARILSPGLVDSIG
ncbi:helix-turn-helix domain-containing protein [Gulosibacter molinativorax]|uniref:TetR/AcrR family transcriptional regulator n=1 Tax=Gulosibacter molinativorax TaxID=256821 RepID=A0ABT7C8N5_9MICO|nr:helix-turn-helix domain-containing protein [Gulosibacter molinativorax]MDJ1371129.1 TetR/AcrR family transcriptional regulator [Gulosibacter molinativorax]QUY61489.1 Transcriptional regulator [Gulosibacter molinativorax]